MYTWQVNIFQISLRFETLLLLVDVKRRILDHPEPAELTMTEMATLYSGPQVSIVAI